MFVLLTVLSSLVFSLAASRQVEFKPSNSSLVVTKVPDYVRPYVVKAYTLDGVRLGAQVYRFPVTGPSSGNAFTLISTASPASSDLGVLPHVSTLILLSLSRSLFNLSTNARHIDNIHSSTPPTTKTSTACEAATHYGPPKTPKQPAAS